MQAPPGSAPEKPAHDDDAVVLGEDHPVSVGVWLSQYTYYYNERIKGVISITLRDSSAVIERVYSVFGPSLRVCTCAQMYVVCVRACFCVRVCMCHPQGLQRRHLADM